MRREDESGLVRKARQGNTEAFGEVIRRYRYLVYAEALGVVKDPGLAEDVAQETFVRAYRSLGELRSERSFPAWLRKIARNRALAARREQARFRPLEEAGSLQSPAPTGAREADEEGREAEVFGADVRRMVSTLSEALRFPLLLCYVDDLSTADAARFLGITEGALRKRLHDGKKKLQERVVRMAEKSFRLYRLPRDFARRCICGCRRAQETGKKGKAERR